MFVFACLLMYLTAVFFEDYIYIYIYIYIYMELLHFLVAQRLETASFLTGGDGCVCILIRTGSYTSVASSFHVNGEICI